MVYNIYTMKKNTYNKESESFTFVLGNLISNSQNTMHSGQMQ